MNGYQIRCWGNSRRAAMRLKLKPWVCLISRAARYRLAGAIPCVLERVSISFNHTLFKRRILIQYHYPQYLHFLHSLQPLKFHVGSRYSLPPRRILPRPPETPPVLRALRDASLLRHRLRPTGLRARGDDGKAVPAVLRGQARQALEPEPHVLQQAG